MSKLIHGLIALAVLILPGSVAAEDLRIEQFLRNLSLQHHFEIDGLSLVGNDRFTPTPKQKHVERQIANSLRSYNHIVKYDQAGQIKLVRIVGKKGDSVGPLSEIPDQTPVPE
ncbi:MAG: hypothetical protein ACE37D_02370 [Pseudomonadales bacterium]